MGSGSQATVNQQQQAAPKVQKGWLLRYTRKQWSRHWFVLNNGSLTYYRAPTAELCSFLDGVLDLSLIKHIEVPQQEEQLALNHRNINHHHHHHHHHQRGNSNSSLINFNGNLQTNAQAQQHAEQHFKFSLKMWNGECHLLSAASSSERQLWLAAINSCNNYDDETASSDSSSSSQSSNISAKSADIGSSHHVGPNVASVSLPSATQQQQSVQVPSSLAPLCGAKSNFSSLAYQQQQEKEAEISIEQLSLKLRSVVRKRQDSDQEAELQQQTNKSNTSQIEPPNDRSKLATSQANGQQKQASSENRQDQLGLKQVARVERTYSSSSSLDCEDNSLDSSLLDGGGAHAVSREADEDELVPSPLEAPPAGRQKKRVTFDLSNQNGVGSSSPATSSAPSSAGASSSSSSSSSSEDEDEDEPEQEEASLSSVSASTSEDDDQDDEQPEFGSKLDEVEVSSEPTTRSESDEGERNTHPISKRFEMRHRLELGSNLRYSCKQKLPMASFDDEDSASELVRRMLEKRKLHLMNKDGDSVKQNRDCDRRNNLTPVRVVDSEEGGATSPISMETNLEQDKPSKIGQFEDKSTMTSDQNDQQSSDQMQQLELEMRLKSVEQNAQVLEKRLNDSYLSYSRLELSYKRLQMELIESRELNIKNVAQLQAKVGQLTSELKLRELELIEAKRKLMKHEEEQQRQRQDSSRKNSGSNWLMRNYSNSMLGPASGNKLLMNLANNSQLLTVASKGAVSQMKINQKLLNQSKQMQRKLDRIELKVDKIENNNNNNLISFTQQTATETSSTPTFEQI